jgi:hypothetical protein
LLPEPERGPIANFRVAITHQFQEDCVGLASIDCTQAEGNSMPDVIIVVIGKRDDVWSRPRAVDMLKGKYRVANYRLGLVCEQGKHGRKAFQRERSLWNAELAENVRAATAQGGILRLSQDKRSIKHFFGAAPVKGGNRIPGRVLMGLGRCLEEI